MFRQCLTPSVLGRLGLSTEVNYTILVLGAVNIAFARLQVDQAMMYNGSAILEAVLLYNVGGIDSQVSNKMRARKQDLEVLVDRMVGGVDKNGGHKRFIRHRFYSCSKSGGIVFTVAYSPSIHRP